MSATTDSLDSLSDAEVRALVVALVRRAGGRVVLSASDLLVAEGGRVEILRTCDPVAFTVTTPSSAGAAVVQGEVR